MNQHVKTGLGTAVLIIIAITVGFFVWTFEKDKPIGTQVQMVKVAPINKSEVAAQSNNENGERQTYRNYQYGFEFQYPKSLIFTENENADYFSSDIEALITPNVSKDVINQSLDINFSIKKTNYKNTSDWFSAWKRDFEKPSDYEGTIIHPKVTSITSLTVDGVAAKRYVPGGSFPFSNLCISFVKGGYLYSACYVGGFKQVDYDAAKIGIDEYGQSKYDVQKLEAAIPGYQKLLDDIIATFKFTNLEESSKRKTYRNEKYGFEITLPEKWNVYSVEEGKDGMGYPFVAITVPDNNKPANMISMINIMFYDKKTWRPNQVDQIGMKVGENAKYYFYYTPGLQDDVPGTEGMREMADNTIKTLKAL